VTRPKREGESGEQEEGLEALAAGLTIRRTIALVGLMGAGKTSIGKRLALALNVPFRDADEEIERAAGITIQEIFDLHGECEFRRGERGVIRRLLNEPPHVLATGGGAFIDPGTRSLMRAHAISIWLRADLDTLVRRVERRDHRPLLRDGCPREILQRLIEVRYPIYSEADLVVDTGGGPHTNAVAAVLCALRAKMDGAA
jgi:shikimate kinase